MFESRHFFEKIYEILKNYIDINIENKGSGLQSNGILKDFEIAGDDLEQKLR